MTSVRRSSRAKRQASSIYEEAKQEKDKRESLSPTKRRTPKKARKEEENEDIDHDSNAEEEEIPEEEEEEEEEAHEEEEEDQSSSDEDNDDEDFRRKKKSPKKATPKKATPKKPKKAAVQIGKSSAHKKKKATARKTNARGGQSALTNLAKKVLEEGETPENSLVAALLYAGKTNKKRSDEDSTEQLQVIARRVISTHRDDPNAAQIQLMNLIFRAVGGTNETCLEEDVDLEDMDNDEWTTIVTNLVDDMRYTAADQVLVCADPDGAVHASREDQNKDTPVTSSSLGVREFRKIFEEFWFVLISVSLTEGYSQEDEEEKTGRFEIEMVRDWIMRINELIEIAQPDIRGAAVVASLKMGLGALTRTVELGGKIDTANRQYKAANKGRKGSNKAESLKFQLDSLRRSQEDLETLVEDNFSAVFMNRYRDSNLHIRATNIEALTDMTLLRPDLYLCDKYLKYIGWTLSDKAACVRVASVKGLSAPFVAVAEKPTTGSQSRRSGKINIGNMSNVIRKFLPRLADCTIDVNVKVQEQAIALFLLLDRANFLEDFEDDKLWEQINNRALASDATPTVRRDALYFIIDQLETFDYDEEEENARSKSKKWSKDKYASLAQSRDKIAANKLDALAGWVAHSLTDGPIPMDNIRIELTDYIVDSLRAMPEHQDLATNWSAIMRAINDCEVSGGSDSERAEIAKQRVLVRMLARATEAEVGAVAADFLEAHVDPDLAEIEEDHLEAKAPKNKGNRGNKAATAHESLSVSLLKSLPELLLKFKADPHILRSVSSLPRFLLPSVISLPQRKKDFTDLIKNLSEVYMHSGNEIVLQNVAESFALLTRGDHVRAQDAQAQLQKLGTELSERLIQLFGSDEEEKPKAKGHAKKKKGRKATQASDSEGEDGEEESPSPLQEKEFAISTCLKRLCTLSKRVDLSEILQSDDETEDDLMGNLRDAIVGGITDRLESRQVIFSNEEGKDPVVPDIWNTVDEQTHAAFADSVRDSLSFLLVSIAWSLQAAQESDPVASADLDETMEEEDEDEIEDHPIAQRRDQLVKLITVCFEQFIYEEYEEEDEVFTEILMDFSDIVQTAALQVTADIRQLLPKEWADAASPLLRACALTEDRILIGASLRYLKSRVLDLRDLDEQDVEDKERVDDLLLPFCRTCVANWSSGCRREAGSVMAHIVGSGQTSRQMVTSMSRLLKKLDPVQLLESHMVCLRLSFDDWLNHEPEEPESDNPTEEEMVEFEQAEKEHRENFLMMVQRASRLSQSLGVGKVDKQLESPLQGFAREGIKYAFSTEMPNEEPLLPGGRLTFLTLVAKYVTWIKKMKCFQDVVVQNLLEREDALFDDPEADQIHEDDLEALASFRKIVGLKDAGNGTPAKSPRSIATSRATEGSHSDEDSLSGTGTTPSNTKKRLRLSRGSSLGSMNSSQMQTLSPLMEEDNSVGSDDDESPQAPKRRKLTKARKSSVGSALTMATLNRESYKTTIEEEDSFASSE